MLTKTSLIVFIVFVGVSCDILWGVTMKKSKYLFFETKKKIYAFFWSRKVKKTNEKYFSHQPVLVRNGFLNRGPFDEVE